MNRSIWTWIQLAISVLNAMFLVLSHTFGPVSAAEIASLLGAQAGQEVVAEAVARINPLHRAVQATL